jgi:hypothetical protein
MKSYFSFPGWTTYLWLGLEQCTKESIAISPDLPVELHEIKTYRRYARRNKYEFQARTDPMNLITHICTYASLGISSSTHQSLREGPTLYKFHLYYEVD